MQRAINTFSTWQCSKVVFSFQIVLIFLRLIPFFLFWKLLLRPAASSFEPIWTDHPQHFVSYPCGSQVPSNGRLPASCFHFSHWQCLFSLFWLFSFFWSHFSDFANRFGVQPLPVSNQYWLIIHRKRWHVQPFAGTLCNFLNFWIFLKFWLLLSVSEYPIYCGTTQFLLQQQQDRCWALTWFTNTSCSCVGAMTTWLNTLLVLNLEH